MSDELLPYYNRELAFMRRLGAEFAEAHPKIAGRLSLGPDAAQDPHVERLIEAFALLNARTRLKLEDDFPEITDALLDVLYPHYLRPVPAMAVVQFHADRTQAELAAGYAIARESPLETETVAGEPCRFRTCYPVKLWPLEVSSAKLTGRPFTAPAGAVSSQAAAVLRLEIVSTSKEFSLKNANLDSLRFFLHGQGQHVFPLYELLMNNVLGIALAASAGDREPVWLDRKCLQPVGFERDEGMFPYAARSFLGYRLLTELFTFPQKFLFVDLAGLDRQALRKLTDRCEIYVFLGKTTQDLEQNVDKETFRLGCAPIVNLYRQRAEPIALSHHVSEYRIVPDARRPLAHEVYSVDRVTATSPDNETVEYGPFYSLKHNGDRHADKRFWQARRERATADGGSEVYVSLVDLGFNPDAPGQWTLEVETTCINRDLPHRLNLTEGASAFRLSQGGPIATITCLTGRATPTLRVPQKRGALWRIISHLSLNHWSLTDSENGADGLREILALYDCADSADTRSMIEGVSSVAARRVPGRSGGGICRGLEVTIHLDEDRFAGHGIYLFAAVLERFLGLYCSLKFVLETDRHHQPKGRRAAAMAAQSGRNGAALSRQLQEQAHQFEFYQAVRLMHLRAHAPEAASRRPLGGDFALAQEVVRFRATPSHSFPAGSVVSLHSGPTTEAPPEMTVAFHGLTGPQGVLPQHYTALLIERVRAKDFSLRDFLDMFNHRALSHFYRAWRKYRFPFAYEDTVLNESGDDLFTQGLYCLLGLGTAGQRGRAEFDDEALLYFSGHFAHWPRSAVALEGVLNEHFQIPTTVKQFQGEWLYLAVEDRSALPSLGGHGQYTALGTEAVVGQRVWDVESKFRLRLGPLSYTEFRRLLPDGDMLRPIREMVRLYAGPHLEFDVQLVLKRREVPRCRLGGDSAGASRLGWNTWVRHGEFPADVDDAIFASKV